MAALSWREQPFAPFSCEKRPAFGARGMVVSNHPLASAAGAEILLGGGNAIDAAIGTLFALNVVEPMMVGVLGGGIAHLRLTSGRHLIIDGLSTAPARARADLFEPLADQSRETIGRKNVIGALAIGVPGALAGWCHALDYYGTRPLASVMAPAIRLAETGFAVTPYLRDCILDSKENLASDPGLAALFCPGGEALAAGARLVQPELAASLRHIAEEGPASLYGGALGAQMVAHLRAQGGILTLEDLAAYQPREREPIAAEYRGYQILGPPPPASAGVHIAQMLNLLEGFDVGAMGFGSVDTVHLLSEVMKIAFADRAAATADPDFVPVPVARLISKEYAQARRASIRMDRAQSWQSEVMAGHELGHTTHVTIADGLGNVVSSTQTLNDVFGASVQIPKTGLIANNYMYNFDPHPGRALSIEANKRVFTSMAPMMALKDSRLSFALGLPGALRIFPSALQAILNLIDHGMRAQEAAEAPRLWCQGGPLELEPAFSDDVAAALAARGHDIARVKRIAGGMSIIRFGEDGMMEGAACWRADGTPVAISGGLARAGVRFST